MGSCVKLNICILADSILGIEIIKNGNIRKVAGNDFNLSPSKYADVNEGENYRPISEILRGLNDLEKKPKKVNTDLQKIFNKLNFNNEMEIG